MEDIFFEFKKRFKEFSNSSSKDEFESSLRIFINSALSKLDVVPRAEFEKQKEMLVKAQNKLKELEKNIDELLKDK